jgi:hypothetical protein
MAQTGGVTGNDLLATLREQAQLESYYRTAPPVACPRDGEPLRQGPPGAGAILYCPFDGFTYPDDWDPESMSGM